LGGIAVHKEQFVVHSSQFTVGVLPGMNPWQNAFGFLKCHCGPAKAVPLLQSCSVEFFSEL
jgi:hypothetical protein